MDLKKSIAPPSVAAQARSMVGAIDMGSKNFKFVLGQRANGIITTEMVRKERLELGREVTENNGLIGEHKIIQMRETLSEFVRYCAERGAPDVLAIATSAIRNARNHEQIIDMARELGLTIDIADGVREGEVGYLAATGGAPNKLVSDAGSKSMQIAWESNGKIHSHSVPVGYELAFEAFVQTASTLHEAEIHLRKFLDGNFVDLPRNTDQFVALAANTITDFVIGNTPRSPQRTLAKSALKNRISELRMLAEDEYNDLKSSLPGVGKILPGLIFLDYTMERSGHTEALISEHELPVGLIVEYFLKRGCGG